MVLGKAKTEYLLILSGKKPINKMSESTKTLDARGLFCPSPVMQTNVELSKMQVGQILTVLADDPAAEDDIASWARRLGHEIIKIEKNGNEIHFEIKKVK